MPGVGFYGVCQRVRQNNGITEILITRRAEYVDATSQEEHVLWNVRSHRDLIVNEGEVYWSNFQSTRPRLMGWLGIVALAFMVGMVAGWNVQAPPMF
jgi:hypothetical protein